MADRSESQPPNLAEFIARGGVPRLRPSERFWPYADLPEEPTADELAALDPDLHQALYGSTARGFTATLEFPKFAGPEFERALELAKTAAECRELGGGAGVKVRARFRPDQFLQLRDLFALVSAHGGCQVLINDRPVPHARELWLPLLWFLLP